MRLTRARGPRRTARPARPAGPRRVSDHAAAAPIEAGTDDHDVESSIGHEREGYRRARVTTERDFVDRPPRRPARTISTQWLRIPGISAQPDHHDDVRRSAEWFADAAPAHRLPDRRDLADGAGLPAVYAEWPSDDPDAPDRARLRPPRRAAGRPARAVAHRPVRPDRSTATVLRARGASDDKGQLLFHLLGLRAHLAATGRDHPGRHAEVPHRGRGGVRLAELRGAARRAPRPPRLRRRRRHRHRHDRRGHARARSPACAAWSACTVDFHGPDLDLHSGVFGGAVPNPATAIARLVAALHDERRPGAGARLLRRRRRAHRRASANCSPRCRSTTPSSSAVAQSRALHGEAGFTTLERVGARPTAEVNGIGGGYQGAGGKTIVPERRVRQALLPAGRRPGPGARSSGGVERFVADHTPGRHRPPTVEWEGDGVAPCLVPLDTPAYRALTDAISAAFDGPPVLPTREGGSGPEAALQQAIGAPLVFLGVGLPDDQIHAPNEKVTLSMLYQGRRGRRRCSGRTSPRWDATVCARSDRAPKGGRARVAATLPAPSFDLTHHTLDNAAISWAARCPAPVTASSKSGRSGRSRRCKQTHTRTHMDTNGGDAHARSTADAVARRSYGSSSRFSLRARGMSRRPRTRCPTRSGPAALADWPLRAAVLRIPRRGY